MKANETAGILRRASDILGERGWCQGLMEDAQGRVCAMGAFAAALDEAILMPLDAEQEEFASALDRRADIHIEFVKAFARAAGLHYDSNSNPIPEWNDRTGRSVEDVVLAMKRAAEHVEGQAK